MSKETDPLGRARQDYEAFTPPSDDARERILRRIADEGASRRGRFLPRWAYQSGTHPRLAMGIAVAAFLLGVASAPWITGRRPASPSLSATEPHVSQDQPAEQVLVEFLFVSPDAHSVSVAGDFNGWNPRVLGMERRGPEGIWIVAAMVPRGRHQYVFVVDGRRWMVDPYAPLAPQDDLGQPSSVLLTAEEGGT